MADAVARLDTGARARRAALPPSTATPGRTNGYVDLLGADGTVSTPSRRGIAQGLMNSDVRPAISALVAAGSALRQGGARPSVFASTGSRVLTSLAHPRLDVLLEVFRRPGLTQPSTSRAWWRMPGWWPGSTTCRTMHRSRAVRGSPEVSRSPLAYGVGAATPSSAAAVLPDAALTPSCRLRGAPSVAEAVRRDDMIRELAAWMGGGSPGVLSSCGTPPRSPYGLTGCVARWWQSGQRVRVLGYRALREGARGPGTPSPGCIDAVKKEGGLQRGLVVCILRRPPDPEMRDASASSSPTGPGSPRGAVELAVAGRRARPRLRVDLRGLGPGRGLGARAARRTTERIGLGSGLMQIPARKPAATAMAAATLDVLSGGRFRLGLG